MSEADKRIAELAAQVNPFDAFHALMFGIKSADGKRFLDLYAEVRRLRGDKVEPGRNGLYDITLKEKLEGNEVDACGVTSVFSELSSNVNENGP